jgi:nickel-dependent lactate racemase
MAAPHFALDVALNRDQQITTAFAGNLFAEHRVACAHVKSIAMQAVPAPFDVVVTTNSGYPLDQNLYQAVKGMSAAAQVVKDGGVIICAAECRDGLPAHGSYGTVLRSQPSPKALLDMIRTPGRPTEPDQWQVQVQAQVQLKASVQVKTHGLSHEEVRAAHFMPIDDVSDAVRRSLRQAGTGATLCVLPQGPQTIAYVSRA